jgi:hypothetical protein
MFQRRTLAQRIKGLFKIVMEIEGEASTRQQQHKEKTTIYG